MSLRFRIVARRLPGLRGCRPPSPPDRGRRGFSDFASALAETLDPLFSPKGCVDLARRARTVAARPTITDRLPVSPLLRVTGMMYLASGAFGAALLLSGAARSETLLEQIIPLIQGIEAFSAGSTYANIAENAPSGFMTSPRRLSAGDQVIVGYDGDGQPVLATVGQDGLSLTTEDTANHARGLPPGFYPIGSMLYQLEPGAQLSLYDNDMEGVALRMARELIFARVDGRIENYISASLPQGLAEVAAVQVNFDHVLEIGEVASTVLGAVNTGQIVTHVMVEYRPDLEVPEFNLPSSSIMTGHSGQIAAAMATDVYAAQSIHQAAGGSAEAAVLALNVASNVSEVTGAVITHIQGRSASIETLVTTAIGAVNGGVVNASE